VRVNLCVWIESGLRGRRKLCAWRSSPKSQTDHFLLRLTLILCLLLLPLPVSAQTITGVASVTDGDSLEIRGMRIRLHGIDAPESRQLCTRPSGQQWRCGQQAALALSDRIGRRSVSCVTRDIDRYGRTIAVCSQDGVDLNRWMVSEGWAVAYRQFSRDYVAVEAEARRAGRNIWSGSFIMPWDWRRGVRTP
jgi:endonuclease YncB( thermonuclease family)